MCAMHGIYEQEGIICSTGDDNSVTFPLSVNLDQYAATEFEFKYCFNAPLTTEPTSSFKIYLLDSAGDTILEATQDIIMYDLTIAEIQEASVTPVNNSQVGEIT